uniref:Uncharacterized protein n=1 Tax=Vespula pensylvanica TaxID=30213 RepID=A0A834UH87_VESPE|nr:hypothetical protein H0235_001263 [Vespula pensylvanica]
MALITSLKVSLNDELGETRISFSDSEAQGPETKKNITYVYSVNLEVRLAIKKYTLSFKYLKNSWKKNTLYLIAIGTPRANRQVERFNPVLTPILAKLSDMPEKWDRILRDVEFSLNNIYCRSTIDYVGHLACISSGR